MKTYPLLLALLLIEIPSRADFSNNQPATSVLGKPDLTSTAQSAASASSMEDVFDVTIDPTTGKLFVSDLGNSRVLRFSSAAAYQSGASAEAVLGQISFSGTSPNQGASVGPNTLNYQAGIHCDAGGRLWVADTSNHRVLRFDGASSKGDGADADGVLGQSIFTANGSATSAGGMNRPADVMMDLLGHLWVADSSNSRVLRFETAAQRANGASANQVLGQINFGSAAPVTSISGMKYPSALNIDAAFRLWVCDFSNHRVLRFDNALGKGDGGNADQVLGQGDFNSGAIRPINAASLTAPSGCVVGGDGTLWVTDDNHRVLGFKGAALKPSGAAADLVLGQPSFLTDDSFSATTRSIARGAGLEVGRDGVLFVADFGLNRVLRFSPTVEVTVPSRVTARNGRARFRGTSTFASLVEYKAPAARFRRAAGTAASWTVNLSRLNQPTTRVPVKASAFDGRSAQKVVVVKARR